MKIHFIVPPAALRVGGLDGAIEGLRGALTAAGAQVAEGEPEPGEREAVVHFHGLWRWNYLATAKRCGARGIPYIVSPHGMLEPWAWRHKAWKKWPYFYFFERSFLKKAAAVLATAEPEAVRLRALLQEARVETLPLGVAGAPRPNYEVARARLGWRPEERVLLFLSRLHPKKGLDLLLQALAQITLPGPSRLVIVGEGEPGYVREWQDWVGRHAASLPRIDWIGAVWGEARWSYFQGADLFCLPTHSENFGLVVPEAWQTGTPVLTTSGTPWSPELAGRGYLCRPEVGSIWDALDRYAAAPAWSAAEREGLAAWAHAGFSWATLAPRYLALYQRLLEGWGPAAQAL